MISDNTNQEMETKMKTVITYGTYDLLHYGHIRLLERAKKLGDYLIVGVTSDAFDRQRGKLNVQQPLSERIEAVKATGLADLIIVEEYEGQKIADIQKYKVDIFTVGSDWVGKFDYLGRYCEVVYLERTKGVSSTEIRTSEHATVKLGCIGMNVPTDRFLAESRYVSGMDVTSCFYEPDVPNRPIIEKLVCDYEITEYQTADELIRHVDAVYIACCRKNNYQYIRLALTHGRHVICESPMFLNRVEANELISLARRNDLVLMEAVKTLYFPAFQHLVLLIGSRVIGDIVHIDVACSQSDQALDMENQYDGSMYDFGSYVLLPIFKILGTEYETCRIKNFFKKDHDFCKLTTGFMEYSNASAMFKAGKGIKTEGELIITGTEGYIYVPAPWWKMEYFEVRYEDLRNTKKYFYQCAGEGLRYEIGAFVRQINADSYDDAWAKPELLAVGNVLELFKNAT